MTMPLCSKTRFEEFGVEELKWPAQSLNLNPTENLEDELEWRFRVRPSHQIHNPQKGKIQNLAESVSRSVEAVIATKGRPTPY